MNELKEIESVLGAQLIGNSVSFNAVSTDTRTLEADNLFFALSGPNFDGHDYIKEAKNKNAAAAVVTKEIPFDIPVLKVDDTIDALGKLAAYHRSKFALNIAAVTGSCGKTTTKTMVTAIFQQAGNTLGTQKSFNNHIGLPLTLLRLQKEHEFAILEMGANGPGNIEYLCSLAKPFVAAITNIAPAHLEGFGSIQGVASAKSEIFQALPKDGVAVVNADDRFADYLKTQSNTQNFVTFGIQNEADIQARNITLDHACRPEFTLVTPKGEAQIKLPFVGEHNVMNALAAAAITYAFDISLDAIQYGLQNAVPVDMRLVYRQGVNDSIVFDDTYNANPLSFDAALHVLAQAKSKKFLVVGDMGELGTNARDFHVEVGVKAKNLGVDRLFTIGELSQAAAEAFGKNASCYQSHDALLKDLQSQLAPGISVLVKGSRKAQMENVVAQIVK